MNHDSNERILSSTDRTTLIKDSETSCPVISLSLDSLLAMQLLYHVIMRRVPRREAKIQDQTQEHSVDLTS